MLPVLAVPVIAIGLVGSLLLGGMGMANIEDYQQQIEKRQQILNEEAEQDVEEVEENYLFYEEDYIKEGIENTNVDIEIDQEYIDELSNEALDLYCNETNMQFSPGAISFIKKQLPEFVKSVIDKETDYKAEKAFSYYIRYKHHHDTLEWLRKN